MKSLKKSPIGLYEKALPSTYSWEERFSSAKQAGFDFMEISIDENPERIERLNWNSEKRKELKALSLSYDIPILTMCLSGNRKYPLGSADESIRRQGVNLVKRAIQFSVDIGIRIIQIAAYDEYYGRSTKETRKLFLESMDECVDFASKVGVTLALETMDSEFMNSIAKAKSIVDLIGSPWLQIYPDIGNLSAWDQDIDNEFRLGSQHIVSIHLKDTLVGQYRRVPFGEGLVDFHSFFQVLKKLKYRGPFVVEMWSDDLPEAEQNVENAIEFVRKRIEGGEE